MNAALLDRITSGHGSVASALDILRETPADPRSPVISSTNFIQALSEKTVRAKRSHEVQRIIAVSATAVGDSRVVPTPEIMKIMVIGNFTVSCRDLEKREFVLAQSGLDTFVMRPVLLIDEKARNHLSGL